MSTGVAPAASPPKQALLGTFAIIERLNPVDAAPGQITLKVTGIPGSAFDGREGIATCFNAPAADDARAKIQSLLAKLKGASHPSLWPVIDAGVAGSIIYWIRSAPIPESLAAAQSTLTVRETGFLAQSIAGGLQLAHDCGLSHGSVGSTVILRYPSGVWTLYGLGIVGRGPASDQFDLANVVVNQLAGRAWIEPDMSGYPEGERAYHRGQRLRETLGSTTERVVNVLNKAMHLDPSQRYASIAHFGDDLVDQIRISGEDLVHGAFEAISARNVELARIIADKAGIYNPESENLAILRLQLNGGSVFGSHPAPLSMATATSSVPDAQFQFPAVPTSFLETISSESGTGNDFPIAHSGEVANVQPYVFPQIISSSDQSSLTLPPMQSQIGTAASALPAELVQGLPPEMVEMFTSQFQQKPVKKGINPMFILVLGGLGMVLLLLVAALVTFFASGT